MAITNSDGSIILSTKVDTSGMEQGTKSLKSQAAKLAAEYRKAGMSQSEAFKKAWSEIERTKVSTDKATVSTKKFGLQAQKSGRQAKVAFDGLSSTLRSVAGYLAMAFSVTKLVQFSSESAKLATQTEASVQRLIDIYGQASDSVGDFIDANARALGMSKAAAASYASVYGNLFSVWADQKTNAELTNHYLNMTAVVASKTGRTVEDVQERIRSGLLGNTEAVEDLGIFVNVKTIEITDAFKRIADGRSWEQLTAHEQAQIRTLAILEQSTQKYGSQVSSTTQTVRLQFRAAYEDFKSTWGQLVNVVLIPVLKTLTKIFSVATALINTLTGKTGNVLEDSSIKESVSDIKDGIGEASDAQEEFTDEVKKTNKEVQKTLAGFDDLQILRSNYEPVIEEPSEETTPEGGADQNISLGLPDLVISDGNEEFDPMRIVEEIKSAIDFILPVIEIGLVVIGLILIACGQIGWGVAFIIAGAYLYSVTKRSEDGTFDFSIIKEDIDRILPYIDEALVAIGLALILLGQLGWGIGFIIAGAIVYGVQEANGEEYKTANLETKLAVITQAVSLALAAIGVVLLFAGHIPLGLGFIVAGHELLDVSEEKLNENAVTTKIDKFFKDNEKLFVGVSLALVTLGIILLSVPSAWGIALGLIATGAVVLAEEAEINGGAITELVRDFLFENSALLALIHGGLFVLGIILVATGVGIPLGIALILESTAGLAGIAKLNHDAIVEWVEDAWNAVKAFWNAHIAPIFTYEWWSNLAEKCGAAILDAFGLSIDEVYEKYVRVINEIIDLINSISITVPDWVPEIGGKTYGFNIDNIDLPSEIPPIVSGSVLPSNAGFASQVIQGEQNKGIQSKLDTFMSAAEFILSQNNNTGANTTEVVLEIDGRELGRAVMEQGSIEGRRYGAHLAIAESR